MRFAGIEEAIERFKENKFVIVMDDESRENEGDLICAATSITSQQMAFLIKYSSGYVCAPMSNEWADRLDLPLMKDLGCERFADDRHGTAYTITCDYAHGTTTGISAHDRALTCRELCDVSNGPNDFLKPGHIVPLRAKDGGVTSRRGHTEAAVDLCLLSGLPPVGVIGELVKDEDGSMMRLDDCIEFGEKFDIPIVTIEQLLLYIKKNKSSTTL